MEGYRDPWFKYIFYLSKKHDICRGDDFRGMPRAVLFAGWRPKNLHGTRIRRPAQPEGPAAPAAG
jgi:hypothetical protein